MFVVTPTEKIVNLDQYAIVEIQPSAIRDREGIYALSRDQKNKVELVSFPRSDENKNKVAFVYQELINALIAGDHVFDLREYVS